MGAIRRSVAFLAFVVGSCSGGPAPDATFPPSSPPLEGTSSSWLAQLPDGPEKRQFMLDCTGCHQFDARIATIGGRRRTESEWRAAVQRMLGFAGPASPFPVISSNALPDRMASWLTAALDGKPLPAPHSPVADERITEFMFPASTDLPHDLAITPTGEIAVTGMFSHAIHLLEPTSGSWQRIPIPVPGANPRAIEIDNSGDWLVVLGQPQKLARFDGLDWTVSDVGVYAHSVAWSPDGKSWVNGHFSRRPEVIVEVSSAGATRTIPLPPHASLADDPAGPLPYEIRRASDGALWMSELQGNRVIRVEPATGATRVYLLPEPHSGPRRLDIGPDGTVWIPAYSAGELIKLDPGTGVFTAYPLPHADALPYVARATPDGAGIWVGTGAADAVFRFDPQTETFSTFRLPTRGALIRHLAVDAANQDVWLAYGESPGKVASRIARLRP